MKYLLLLSLAVQAQQYPWQTGSSSSSGPIPIKVEVIRTDIGLWFKISGISQDSQDMLQRQWYYCEALIKRNQMALQEAGISEWHGLVRRPPSENTISNIMSYCDGNMTQWELLDDNVRRDLHKALNRIYSEDNGRRNNLSNEAQAMLGSLHVADAEKASNEIARSEQERKNAALAASQPKEYYDSECQCWKKQ